MSEGEAVPRSGVASRLALIGLGLVLGVVAQRFLHPAGQATTPDGLPWGVREAGDSSVVARVGNEVVTASEFEARWSKLLDEDTRRFHESRGGRSHFLGEVAEEVLLAQEAARLGLLDRPEVAAAVRASANRALASALLAQEVRGKVVPDADVTAYFEAHRSEWGSPLRVEVSELVVTSAPGPPGVPAGDDATTAEAARAKIDRLRARVASGEDFASVARNHSEAASASYGGYLGWVVEGRLVKAYEEAALALQPGELSPVIEVPDGFVVLRAAARDEGNRVTALDVKDQIVGRFLAEDPGALLRRYRAYVDELAARESFQILGLPPAPDQAAPAAGAARPNEPHSAADDPPLPAQ